MELLERDLVDVPIAVEAAVTVCGRRDQILKMADRLGGAVDRADRLDVPFVGEIRRDLFDSPGEITESGADPFADTLVGFAPVLLVPVSVISRNRREDVCDSIHVG